MLEGQTLAISLTSAMTMGLLSRAELYNAKHFGIIRKMTMHDFITSKVDYFLSSWLGLYLLVLLDDCEHAVQLSKGETIRQ